MGERTLLGCGRERLLLVMAQGDVRRVKGGSVIANVTVTSLGATCERTDRRVFEHGVDFYRIVFARGQVRIFRTRVAY